MSQLFASQKFRRVALQSMFAVVIILLIVFLIVTRGLMFPAPALTASDLLLLGVTVLFLAFSLFITRVRLTLAVCWGNTVGIFVLALPAPRTGIVAWLQKHFFSTWYDGVFSIIFAVSIVWVLQSLVGWAFLDAIWRVENRDLCTSEAGACWAVIESRGQLILFGLYQYDQQWQSTLACLVIIMTIYFLGAIHPMTRDEMTQYGVITE